MPSGTGLAPRNRNALLLVAAIFAAVALAFVAQLPRETLWSPDCNLKYLQTQVLRWDASGFHSDIPYAGRAWDPELHFVPLGTSFYEIKSSQIHVVWPLTFAMLAFPFYRALGFVGLFVIPIFSGAGVVLLSGLIAERIKRGRGIFAAIIVGASTPIFVYSCLYWEHSLATFFATLGIYFLLPDGASPRVEMRRRIAGGASIGIAAAGLRADIYTLAGALVVVVAITSAPRFRELFALVSGLLLGSIPLWIINYRIAQRILPLNAAKNFTAPSGGYLALHWKNVLEDFFVGDTVSSRLGWIFTGISLCLIVVGNTEKIPKRGRMLVTSLALVAACLVALAADRQIFSMDLVRYHGLFIGSPLLLMAALPGAADSDQRSRSFLERAAALYALLYLVAISLTAPLGPSGGGLELGPRFLLTLFPILAVLVAVTELPTGGSRWVAQIAIAGALSIGVMFQLHALRLIEVVPTKNKPDVAAMLSTGDLPLVTDLWWLPILDSVDLPRRPMFLVGSEEMLDAWLTAVGSRHLEHFVFASFIPPELHPSFLSNHCACFTRRHFEIPGSVPMYELECHFFEAR